MVGSKEDRKKDPSKVEILFEFKKNILGQQGGKCEVMKEKCRTLKNDLCKHHKKQLPTSLIHL